jgi:hypothetical protein
MPAMPSNCQRQRPDVPAKQSATPWKPLPRAVTDWRLLRDCCQPDSALQCPKSCKQALRKPTQTGNPSACCKLTGTRICARRAHVHATTHKPATNARTHTHTLTHTHTHTNERTHTRAHISTPSSRMTCCKGADAQEAVTCKSYLLASVSFPLTPERSCESQGKAGPKPKQK